MRTVLVIVGLLLAALLSKLHLLPISVVASIAEFGEQYEARQ